MKNITKLALTTVALTLLLAGCSESDGYSSSANSIDKTDLTVPTPKPDPYKVAGWYAKTEVSATAADGKVYSHKTAGVFGELVQSDDAKDQHDISAYGTAIFQVVFPQTEWSDDNGDYFSNYQHFDKESTAKRVWTFQIKNQHTVNLANAPITINLEGTYDVEYRDDRGRVEYQESSDVNVSRVTALMLVDVDNQVEYTVDELATANLTMDGKHTRTFRWVLGTTDATDYEPLPAPQRAAGRTAASEFKAAPPRQGGGKFGLPPL